MGRPKKNPFDDLDQDYKDMLERLSEIEIRSKIAEVSLNQAALIEAMEQDQDLAEKKEAAKEAGRIYSEGTKANRLRIRYARQMLEAKGRPSGSFDVEAAAEAAQDAAE